MSFERVHRSKSQSPQSSSSTSQFALRPFPVQEPQRPPTLEDIENEAFQQNKFEAFGFQLKEKHGTITPVEQERLGVLQAKMDGFWAQRMERAKAQPNLLEILIRNSQATQTTESQAPVQSNTIQAKGETTGDHSDSLVEQQPNRTGLPDTIKAGVENLSGCSLNDVRVHYNSPKPAQVKALAYTQGTEIHLAPGQEKHLPHETWHVVQQMQGRVKPTMQLKDGLSVNDSDELEYEADLMGAKAVANPVQRQGALAVKPSNAVSGSPHQVVQMTSYIRALNSDARIATEIASLQRVFLDETNRQHQVNTWVDGFAGMPTARFTSAKRHYYSPVGYKLETENDADVLANYQGDGNTNDIPVTHPRWVIAAQNLREAVMQVQDYTNWVNTLDDDPWYPLPEVNADTGTPVRSDYVNYYLKPYLKSIDPEDPATLQERNNGKTAVREAIKNSGIAMLRTHYSDPNIGVPARYMGTGREPEGMAAAINNPNLPYIESILHAKFNQVTAAWYNKDLGNYAEATAQPGWRASDPNWLANRRTSAQAIRYMFNQAGANNIQVEEIGPEPQEE